MTRMTASLSATRAARVVGSVAVVLGILAVPTAARAAGKQVGAITITTPNGSSLAGGGSRTVYSVHTPNGAKCPGDTAHDFYLVNSYLVRKGTSPTAVNFRGGVPSRGFGFISEGAYYGAINTERDTGKLFIFPERTTWSRLKASDLFPHNEPSTVWEAGIACADRNGVVATYWNTEVTFTADTKDPSGFQWSVAAAPPGKKTSTSDLLIDAVLIVAAGGLIFSMTRTLRDRRARQSVSVAR